MGTTLIFRGEYVPKNICPYTEHENIILKIKIVFMFILYYETKNIKGDIICRLVPDWI